MLTNNNIFRSKRALILLIYFVAIHIVSCTKNNEVDGSTPCSANYVAKYGVLTDTFSIEGLMVNYINKYRAENNLPEVKMAFEINNVAQKHCDDMNNKLVPINHTGIELRSDKIRETFPCAIVGENIGWGPRTVSHVMELWFESETHKANILGDFDLVGVGAVKDQNGQYYFSTIYILSKGNFDLPKIQ